MKVIGLELSVRSVLKLGNTCGCTCVVCINVCNLHVFGCIDVVQRC